MNIQKLLQLKGMKNKFVKNHPMFPKFISKIKQVGLEENDLIEIIVKKTNGETYTSNIKISTSDLELLEQVMELGSN